MRLVSLFAICLLITQSYVLSKAPVGGNCSFIPFEFCITANSCKLDEIVNYECWETQAGIDLCISKPWIVPLYFCIQEIQLILIHCDNRVIIMFHIFLLMVQWILVIRTFASTPDDVLITGFLCISVHRRIPVEGRYESQY